jgi:hypothetical protein
MPWWACLTIALTGSAAYICRSILLYRLTRQAITKASPTQLPAIINAITPGHHAHGAHNAAGSRWRNRSA